MSEVKEFRTEPRVLYRTIRALVKRPRASLTMDDKKEETEVVVIDDFELQDSTRPARFDVYIAKLDEGIVSSDLGEYVGGYVYIPHSTDRISHQADLQIGITGIVEDIEADASEELVVSIVPRGGLFTIPGVSIQLLKHEIPSSEELNEESLD
ncbi:hypothetical protein IFM89_003822 [Coptis chinensis]|uniref:Polyphenol oxidase C-terminal domain-containing protein n=1 Tax=Coptis chinensis TaxID=261450 RepID=A0A835HLC6_9MAGN|nr:hypothetical protein IFM89_003822 [Coptis chinensis]